MMMMMTMMMMMMMKGEEQIIDQLCRDGSRNSSLRSVVRLYHDLYVGKNEDSFDVDYNGGDETDLYEDYEYNDVSGMQRVVKKVKDYDDVDDVYDDVHIDDDGSGLDKVSGELSGRSRSVEVLTRQGMSSLKGR